MINEDAWFWLKWLLDWGEHLEILYFREGLLLVHHVDTTYLEGANIITTLGREGAFLGMISDVVN